MILGIFLAIFAAACGALSHALGKKAMHYGFTTNEFLVLRLFTGVLVNTPLLIVYCLHNGLPPLPLIALVFILLLAIAHPISSNLLYYNGLRKGDLSVVAPLLYTAPFFGTVLSFFILGVKKNLFIIPALLFILLGAVVVPLLSTHCHDRKRLFHSMFCGLGGALAMGMFYVLLTEAVKHTDRSMISFGINVVALLFVILLATGEQHLQGKKQTKKREGKIPMKAIYAGIGSGFLAFGVCLFLSISVLKLIDPSLYTCLTSSGVIFSLIYSMILFNERPPALRFLGALLIAIGCLFSVLA